jgi:signal peptidase II
MLANVSSTRPAASADHPPVTEDSPATRPRRITPARRWTAVGLAVLAVLVVDQWTKRWALDRLYPFEVIDLVGSLRFNLAFNTGMAFSGFSGAGALIGAIAILIAVVLLVVARKVTSVLQLVLIGIVIGGALGNVIDRASRVGEIKSKDGTVAEGFMSGAVIDFIDVQWWPVFNVADASIVVGGLALAITGLRTTEDEPDEEPVSDEEGAGGPGPDPDPAPHPESTPDHTSGDDPTAAG